MPCLPERPLCRVSFKQFSSFLRRCSGDGGRAAKPQILRKSASGNTQYKLTQASTFPGQGASPLTRWGGCPQPANGRWSRLPPRSVLLRLCRKGRHWRPAPLDPSSALPPLHPATKGLPPSVLPLRRSWLPPQKRFPPVSPAPHPHSYAYRREVDTEYACGDCRSKRRVQTRHFCRNRPDFRRFFLLPLPPESHALWRKHWRRLSVPRCKAG